MIHHMRHDHVSFTCCGRRYCIDEDVPCMYMYTMILIMSSAMCVVRACAGLGRGSGGGANVACGGVVLLCLGCVGSDVLVDK